ncbi:6192_t:CDS:2 [Acaulospora morrowiae]|uniref:6192_t:CDS:1 n=1 Tax=Acaulospora morrowiae TaxID=94023 RepID=A0A9N8YS18_9GLOM|nr:6192_t:CDS:2 [Acaulospora morrowiae]
MRLFERENRISEDRIPLFHVYVAGSGAGAACCLVSTPTELIKCRAQVIKSPVSDNHLENIKTSRTEPGSFEIFKKTLNPFSGLYHGGLITIIRDAPGYGLYFWTYEGIKRLTHVTPDNSDYSNVSKLLFAGGMAGVVSWAGVYPLDVIKSRIQTQQRYPSVIPAKPLSSLSVINSTRAISGSFRGIIDCAVRSYHKEGISVFFRGIIPTLVRAWPVNAVTFYIYEVTVDLLKNV